MSKLQFDDVSKKTNMGSLGFRYALTGWCLRDEYLEKINILREVFGEPNRRHQFGGIQRYGLWLRRENDQLARWFVGPRKWTSPPGKNRDIYTFAFRSEKDRLIASMMI